MKLWKENKVAQEYEMDNAEIANRFMQSQYYFEDEYVQYYGIGRALAFFISAKDGLNSIWEWDKNKGSIEGSPDVLAIIALVHNAEKQK